MNDSAGSILWSIAHFLELPLQLEPVDGQCDGDLPVPSEVSEAISNVSDVEDLRIILSKATYSNSVHNLLLVWIGVHLCLEDPTAGPACECAFVYIFIMFCHDEGLGVPKLALALYDKMNMQLSREFIRCANPTCEANKLDKSTGQVRFKQCSRCKTTIYCSRECQAAHYPKHKKLCREHSTSSDGSEL